MAFSFRKIISNISYFSKSEDENHPKSLSDVPADRTKCSKNYFSSIPASDFVVEADSTSKCASLNLTDNARNYSVKKGSLSDTDLLSNNPESQRKKCRKLKLDIAKANQSVSDSLLYSETSSNNVENTPTHKLLDCKATDFFRGFNFNQSFDLSGDSSYEEDNIDIESISEHSDTDLSIATNVDEKPEIKMCRKVETEVETAPSVTPESFTDVEVDKNENEINNLILNYHMKIEKQESILQKLLSELQFHIEVSKIFTSKTCAPNKAGRLKPVSLGRGVSPAWQVISQTEMESKSKLKNQLLSMRHTIDTFIVSHFHEPKSTKRKIKVSYKKKIKNYDFPDLREAMIKLFDDGTDSSDELDCNCHCHSTDSGLISKSEKDSNHSITSSIGNFTLDSTTLSAYSESLDVISYSSFHDSSLYNTLLQKSAIERITFYIQVHSIQLKSESMDESKNSITFYCPACSITEYEENGLMRHILGSSHCAKIHFIYKTAYVKKCIAAGKEIQPSTVLNPMTMYRDENKIVCFGDAMYACSLCFENLIVGESILMAHCSDEEHVERKERLSEIFD